MLHSNICLKIFIYILLQFKISIFDFQTFFLQIVNILYEQG